MSAYILASAKFVAIDGYPVERWEEAARESARLEPTPPGRHGSNGSNGSRD